MCGCTSGIWLPKGFVPGHFYVRSELLLSRLWGCRRWRKQGDPAASDGPIEGVRQWPSARRGRAFLPRQDQVKPLFFLSQHTIGDSGGVYEEDVRPARGSSRTRHTLIGRLELEALTFVDPANQIPDPLGLTNIVTEGVVESRVGQPVPIPSVNCRECHLTHRMD